MSRAGTAHPITRLLPDEADNLSLWREMPPLDGANLLLPKASGTVLLESTFGAILTVGSYGKGRVLALATDYSWKWYMGMVAKGRGNWAYLRLMERMVRWLTKDPSLDPVQIALPGGNGAGVVGQEMEVRIKVREEDFSPNPKGVVSVSVLNPDGIKIGSRLKATPQGRGEYLASFLPEKGGAYKLRVDTPSGHLEESIFISGPGEKMDAAPNHELLRMVAASTGGKPLSTEDDLLKEIEAHAERGRGRFLEERRLPLWGRPYTLALILALLTTEWYLRRRWGLV